MTPERCKELLPVMQAFAEGKEIQFRNHSVVEAINNYPNQG